MNAPGAYLMALFLAGCPLVATAPLARAVDPGETPHAPWVDAIRAMDEALARKDLRAALRAREDARLAALASPRWEGLAMVGDATLRLARSAGLLDAMEPAARRAYVFALHRARRQGSLDGVLRVTRAFAGLGDHDMVRRGFAIAESLATTSGEPQAVERVRALEEELAAEMPRAGGVPEAAAAPMDGALPGPDERSRGSHSSE
jgi:hypothetical protein